MKKGYDITWYDRENMELVKGIALPVLADLWLMKFGKQATVDRISEDAVFDVFYRAATAKLLMEGWMVKQVGFERDSITFYLKEHEREVNGNL